MADHCVASQKTSDRVYKNYILRLTKMEMYFIYLQFI
jgi:hypothetical protein